jgi:chromosome segregation ATPase
MEIDMNRFVSGVLIVAFGSCLTASSAFAAEDPTHNDLAEINATLKEIARMLKQQLETQKGDLLLKRVTFAATQLANAQERLNGIDREIGLKEKDRGEWESMLSAQQKAPPGDPAVTQSRIAALRSDLQSIQDRLNALHQERITVENDVQTLRREARDWQTLLDKTITGGQT